jgi:hypothetical protein
VTAFADHLRNRRVDLGRRSRRGGAVAFNFPKRRILAHSDTRHGVAQIHVDGIARKERGTWPVERRYSRFNRGMAAVFLDGSLAAERLHPAINRKLDGALWFSPRTRRWWFARRLTFPSFAAPGRARRISVVTALAIERPAQTLKFENQRLTLWSDAVGIRLATPVPVRSVERSMILRVRHG